MKHLKPGDKLLHRATHESLTFVQWFGEDTIIVSDKENELRNIKLEHIVIDYDRQFIKSVKQIILALWQRVSLKISL